MNKITQTSPKITSPLNFKANQPVKQQIMQTDRFEPSFEGKGSKVAAGIGAFALLLSILGLAGCSNEPAQKPESPFYYEDPARIKADQIEGIVKKFNELTGAKVFPDDVRECLKGLDQNKVNGFIGKLQKAKSSEEEKNIFIEFLVSEGINKEKAEQITENMLPKMLKADEETLNSNMGLYIIIIAVVILMTIAAGGLSDRMSWD